MLIGMITYRRKRESMNEKFPAARMDIRDEVATLKRTRIIAAAIKLFYERGYENSTLDAVVERLGVTKPFIICALQIQG